MREARSSRDQPTGETQRVDTGHPPAPAKRPRAEAEHRHLETRPTESAIIHKEEVFWGNDRHRPPGLPPSRPVVVSSSQIALDQIERHHQRPLVADEIAHRRRRVRAEFLH